MEAPGTSHFALDGMRWMFEYCAKSSAKRVPGRHAVR
uniref:Uncharacterized protein n=1 Tax=Anopheles minimus TaxID=112268 RepID=A0A182WNI9_9DIPT